jgi:hypothetical protein
MPSFFFMSSAAWAAPLAIAARARVEKAKVRIFMGQSPVDLRAWIATRFGPEGRQNRLSAS